jgi:streptogrisin D
MDFRFALRRGSHSRLRPCLVAGVLLVAAERADHDFMLIGTPSAQGRIYDGPVGTGEFEKPVIGYGFTTPGQHVCFSGSVTGAICNIFNSTAMSNSLCYTDIFGRGTVCVNDLVLAAHATGQRICQGGDSGGPVFDLRNPNWNNVVARGIGSFCNTVQGGNRMLYGKFSNAVNDFGIGPLTSS